MLAHTGCIPLQFGSKVLRHLHVTCMSSSPALAAHTCLVQVEPSAAPQCGAHTAPAHVVSAGIHLIIPPAPPRAPPHPQTYHMNTG